MPSIPQFQRRKLASSVVGTPGVDTSAEQLLQQTAEGARSITSSLTAIQKQKRSIVDAVDANNEIIKFEDRYAKTVAGIHGQFEEDPTQAPNAVLKAGQEIANEQLQGITSGAVKASVSRMQQSVIKNQSLKTREWENERDIVNTGSKLLDSMNTLADAAFNTNDFSRVNELLQTASKSGVAAKGVLGNKTAGYVKDGQKNIARGYLYGLQDRDPIKAQRLLETDAFKEIRKLFDADEMNGIRKDIAKSVKSSQEKDTVDLLSGANDQNKALVDKYSQGDLALVEVDRQIAEYSDARVIAQGPDGNSNNISVYDEQLEILGDLRDMVLEGTDLKAFDEPETINQLFDDWSQLYIKKGSTINTKAALEEIVRFERKATTAAKKGLITDATFSSFVSKIANRKRTLAEEETGRGKGLFRFRVNDGLHTGYRYVDNWLKDFSKDPALRSQMMLDYVDAYDNRANLQGKELTSADAEKLAQEVVGSHFTQLGINLQAIPKGGQLFNDRGTGAVIRIMPDGTIKRER